MFKNKSLKIVALSSAMFIMPQFLIPTHASNAAFFKKIFRPSSNPSTSQRRSSLSSSSNFETGIYIDPSSVPGLLNPTKKTTQGSSSNNFEIGPLHRNPLINLDEKSFNDLVKFVDNNGTTPSRRNSTSSLNLNELDAVSDSGSRRNSTSSLNLNELYDVSDSGSRRNSSISSLNLNELYDVSDSGSRRNSTSSLNLNELDAVSDSGSRRNSTISLNENENQTSGNGRTTLSKMTTVGLTGLILGTTAGSAYMISKIVKNNKEKEKQNNDVNNNDNSTNQESQKPDTAPNPENGSGSGFSFK